MESRIKMLREKRGLIQELLAEFYLGRGIQFRWMIKNYYGIVCSYLC